MSYHSFKDEDGNEYGSFEVFDTYGTDSDGWYWWPCWPGCLPDGDDHGPFETEALALADALND